MEKNVKTLRNKKIKSELVKLSDRIKNSSLPKGVEFIGKATPNSSGHYRSKFHHIFTNGWTGTTVIFIDIETREMFRLKDKTSDRFYCLIQN